MNQLLLGLGVVSAFSLPFPNGQAQGAAYVVDRYAPGAADTNTGTEGSPFRTLQYAVTMAKPGDTVFVMEGKYDERVKVETSWLENQPIIIRATPLRSTLVAGFDLRANYIQIEGFEITAEKPS